MVVPADLGDLRVFLFSCLGITLWYCFCCLFSPSDAVRSERVRAWYIASLTSVVTTSVGMVMLADFLMSGAVSDITGKTSFSLNDSTTSRYLCLFFLAYCVMDLVIGAVQYGSQFEVGVEHHTFYAALLVYLLWTETTSLFAVCALEELPTIILCVHRIFDRPLSTGFGMVFFVSRITLHLCLMFAALEHINGVIFLLGNYILVQHLRLFGTWQSNRISKLRAGVSKQNEDDGALATTEILNLSLKWRAALLASVMGVQLALHTILLGRQVTILSNTVSSYSMLAVFVAGHMAVFGCVVVEMVKVVQGVYSEHFIMSTIEKMKIIYNISWEDPAVEREHFDIGPGDKILTISSAGCNVLDYLCSSPEAIVACDFNAAQLAVLELKLACIRSLGHEDFFSLWGRSDVRVYDAHYTSTLRPLLSPVTATFWDKNRDLFADNFMFCGSSGLMAWLFQWPAILTGVRSRMQHGAGPPSKGPFISLLLYIMSFTWLWAWLAPLGGVPEAQLNLVSREPQVWSNRMAEILMGTIWEKGNYFYYGYIMGQFSKNCCPRYLEEANYATLKRNVDRVTLHHGPIAEAAQLRDDFTLASLLDSMDWMPDSMIAAQMAALVPRLDAQKGRIFWRSFATKVHSPVLAQLRPYPIETPDRVGWYLTQWGCDVTASHNFAQLTNQGTGECPRNGPLQELRVIVAMGAHALQKEKDVRAFYRSQGDAYDGFREALLPGRDRLLQYVLPWQTEPKTWVSIGCGTARDVEYVVGHVAACDTKLWLVDLSPELLEVAQNRVARLGLSDRVVCVQADVCDAYATRSSADKLGLPPLESVDMVTCSYCLTMIPDWRKALDVMRSMVRFGGTLALVDFTQRIDRPRHWTQRLNAWWFANDGVYLDVAQPSALLTDKAAGFETVWYSESESRVPYTMLHATTYLYAGIKGEGTN